MKESIIYQALINMGYRSMNEKNSVFGKPIGFGIIISIVKENIIEFTTMFINANNEPTVWNTSNLDIDNYIKKGKEGEELYKEFTFAIAYQEFQTIADKLLFPINGDNTKTFDFK